MEKMLDIPPLNNFTKMGEIDIELIADEGLFRGLANQNMLFHQCICELVDNSIAQKQKDQPFKIDIIFEYLKESENYNVYIVDNGKGMDAQTLGLAMQPGESAAVDNRLNEHGFGLKHSLATLTKKTGHWKIWSKNQNSNTVSSVHSPFKHKMKIKDDDTFPIIPYSTIKDPSTIIRAEITLKYFQSVQISRGAKSTSIDKLLDWLIEHLGVTYRGYLSQNSKTLEYDGLINIIIDNKIKRVPPIEIPMQATKTEPIVMTLEGKSYTIYYKTGLLDDRARNELLDNKGLLAYYLGNRETQGIDIRLGKRVISTKQLNNIFGVEPHNKYNIFVGELLIPELPRNVLKTVNNKTAIDFDDHNWDKIFNELRTKHKIPEDPRFAEEEQLRSQWMKKLKAVEPLDDVLSDAHVWFSGVRIDVYRKRHETGAVTIYELKAGKGEPIDLYQLKMYWDGLVDKKEYPTNGILICEKFDPKLKEMADRMNLMTPQENAKPYNFSIQTIEELELIKQPKKTRNK